MKIKEPGVLERDGIYFWSAGAYAKENLFYPLWGAVYRLDVPYRVKRSYLDAFMLQYIVEGELHFELRNEHFAAKEKEIVLLNCMEPNHYWSEGPARVKWFHFHGNGVLPLLDYIYAKNGSGHLNQFYGEKTEIYMDAVLQGLKNKETSEFQFSHEIYSLLCELAAAPPSQISTSDRMIQRAVTFMREHYREEISVKDIASSAGVSLYYFTRLFKKLKLQSPHLYLLNLRMDEAKKLLVYTADTIDVVADKTGFQSASHFIRAFKKAMNMTPNTFRNYFSARKV